METLICISSKYPNPLIYDCIKNLYERNFGIYFIDKCIRTYNLYEFMYKINGKRD